MHISTKFNLGDTVFHISCGRVWQDIPCPTCGESGKVLIGGEEFVCPKCSGRTKDKRTVPRWYVERSGQIGKLEFVAFDRFGDGYDRDEPQCETYMFTASGSGTCYPAETLFATREEATAECDRRNAAGEWR